MSSNPLNLHPVDYYNAYGSFLDIFKGQKDYHAINDTEIAMADPVTPGPNDLNHVTFKLSRSNLVGVRKANPYHFPNGATISKFQLLCAVKFKSDQSAAISYITHELMGVEIPYIRVGCHYYKVIKKDTRYGGIETVIKGWDKSEIKQDHGPRILNAIPKFDDFIISPDNKKFKPIIKNCYNLYSEFQHTPHPKPVTTSDIPVTLNFISHIFGTGDFNWVDDDDGTLQTSNRLQMGLTYFKCIYEHPKQLLPILCLVSADNETGKTTFLNFLSMIFSGNFSTVSPEDLLDKFNSVFATKNIIAAEETFFEKGSGVDKLKYLSTAGHVWLALKFREKENVPFFGKFILNTNKVKDFMRIDSKEIRFWIRKIPKIKGKKNTRIEEQLFNEIPKFLRFLTDLPPINFNTGSRMLFKKQQLETEELIEVKQESRSQLYKEIEMEIQDFFDQNPAINSFMASSKDIKMKWFSHNNQVSMSYIRKVLKEEAGMSMECSPTGTSIKYAYPFWDGVGLQQFRVGTPFKFERQTPGSAAEELPF